MTQMTKEQKFLYNRIAILITSVGLIASALVGWKDFPFWHAPFALCFWLAFALLNYPYKTSLWMFVHRRIPFLIFYGALTGSLILLDQLALRLHLWFYPFYHDFWFIFVYGVLYPIAALAQLEFFYFLAHLFQEPLTFKQHKATGMHRIVDGGEGILFLLMMLFIVLGAAGYSISLFALLISSILWMLFAVIKFGVHIAHSTHLLLLLIITGSAIAFLHKFPNAAVFEWVYLETPLLYATIFNVPLWVWLGSFWSVLFTFRLWIFLVLHPRVK